jgi:hypothetical protein
VIGGLSMPTITLTLGTLAYSVSLEMISAHPHSLVT